VDETIVNIHDAKARLSQLGPIAPPKGSAISPDDPLLNLEQFATEGPGGALSNADIDRLVYGKS
jgi:hypothetical protein